MAVLMITPETIAAIRVALANCLKWSVNIVFGLGLGSIGMATSLVRPMSLAADRARILGMDCASTVMLLFSLLTNALTFSNAANEPAIRLSPSAAFFCVSYADI
jgi:Ca2+:H+ antiporter